MCFGGLFHGGSVPDSIERGSGRSFLELLLARPTEKTSMNKKTHCVTTGVVAAAIVFAGCSSSGSSNPSSTAAQSTDESTDEFRPPIKGETKEQVLAQYDDPDQVFGTSEGGETWIYVFGKAKLFIPFYGAFAHLQYLTIYFDERGRVSNWETGTQRPFAFPPIPPPPVS
jgi:hypothetical protein